MDSTSGGTPSTTLAPPEAPPETNMLCTSILAAIKAVKAAEATNVGQTKVQKEVEEG